MTNETIRFFEIACILAISAPTDEQSREATELANRLARGLPPEVVAASKAKIEGVLAELLTEQTPVPKAGEWS